MREQEVGIKGVRMVVIAFGALLKGDIVLGTVIVVMPDDGDAAAEVLGEQPRNRTFPTAGAAGNPDNEHFCHGVSSLKTKNCPGQVTFIYIVPHFAALCKGENAGGEPAGRGKDAPPVTGAVPRRSRCSSAWCGGATRRAGTRLCSAQRSDPGEMRLRLVRSGRPRGRSARRQKRKSEFFPPGAGFDTFRARGGATIGKNGKESHYVTRNRVYQDPHPSGGA